MQGVSTQTQAPVPAGYRLGAKLGQGGLGSVYLAFAADGTRVALKLFDLRGEAGADLEAAFRREVDAGRRLEHDDIVRVVGSGVELPFAYLATEYVAGVDLSAHTRPTDLLPAIAAVHIAARIAGALGFAHRQGIVHRDIKPGNVLVNWPGDTVKVADFGLARLGDAFRSRTGIIAGTPSYMSPEQLTEGSVDARTDVYALGAVLFEMLTGRLPHAASSMGALLRQVATEVAPPLHTLRPDLPTALCDAVANFLDKRAEHRPADGKTAAGILADVVARWPQSTAPGGGPMSRR